MRTRPTSTPTRTWAGSGTGSGQQPTLPAAGTNRRLTVFGSVEALGRGRVEVLQVRQDSAGFARYLAALEARHAATGRHMILVLDNGPCHVSKATQAALAARADWLEVIPLARYSPAPQPQGARVAPSSSATTAATWPPTLRAFVDAVAAGLAAAWAGRRVRSSTRCRSGGWTGTARSRPDARRGDPRAPRTASPASRRARTYQQVLSTCYGLGSMSPQDPRHPTRFSAR